MDVDYLSSVPQGQQGGPAATSYGDFDLAYDPINAYQQGSGGGAYIVRSGDTLQEIAAGLWGDASLWYKIAEANGLSAQSALPEGMSLILPVGVQLALARLKTRGPCITAPARLANWRWRRE